MSRDNVLTQAECFAALRNGFILQNEHGFTVKLKNGKQFITNKRRLRKRGKAYPYQFDYPTWQPIGRINWWERLKNKIMM